MSIQLRTLISSDRVDLAQLLERVPNFEEDDRAIAMELVVTALDQPEQKDYCFLIAEDGDVLVGYACYGPTPLTDGTFDLYWIAVDPQCAGQGIGTLILKAMEEQIQRMGGRMIVIETSSAENYAQTQQFYLKNGYELAETIRDFYRPGEDRVTYLKRL